VHLRGGFSLNGGAMWLPSSSASPAFGAGLRLGLQLGDWLAIEYQNTPLGTATIQSTGSGLTSGEQVNAGFLDYNSLLLMVTLWKVIDLGYGPSIDYLAVSNNSVSLLGGSKNTSSSGVSFGTHGRVGINIGAFCIEGDVHSLFTPTGNGTSLTAGIGAEFK
jgi:hypothetical protein